MRIFFFSSVLSFFYSPKGFALRRTPSGTATATTSAIPITKPIASPIKHFFEQQVRSPLKF